MAVINGDNNSNTLNGVFDAGGDVGDTIRGFGGYDTLNAYNPLTINVNWSIIDVLEGGDGNDTLRGKNGGTDKLYGGAGDDYLIPLQRYNEPDGSVLDGTNEMIGGLGNDKYFIYAGGPAYNILTELPMKVRIQSIYKEKVVMHCQLILRIYICKVLMLIRMG